MNGVKVRRVGNSTVVTVPREMERHGLVEGTVVVFVPLESGAVLIVPTDRMDEYMQEVAARVVARNRGALEKLAEYDRAGSED